jgi:hypothetical protein
MTSRPRGDEIRGSAVAESLNSTFEWELLRNSHSHTREQARRAPQLPPRVAC